MSPRLMEQASAPPFFTYTHEEIIRRKPRSLGSSHHLSLIQPQALVDAVDAVGFGAAPLQEEDFQAIDLASPAPVPAPASDPTGAPPDVTLAIEGMMCQKNCGSTVQRALGGVPGVAAARVSFDEGQAWVWLRPSPEAPTVQVRGRQGYGTYTDRRIRVATCS